GVMIDDLVTRGVSEPYRMFTSRAEYRLKLRADNADQRLTPLGLAIGCVGPDRQARFSKKLAALAAGEELLKKRNLTPNEARKHGIEINHDGRRRSAFELLSFSYVDFDRLIAVWPELDSVPRAMRAQLEIDARYAAYVERQEADVDALRKDEALEIPSDFDFAAIPSLSTEVRQKLLSHRPGSLAHAARIDGITPAALLLVRAHLKKSKQRRSA
ncbi:MAG: tRNA uridine-5-carboxymethylaminomethyl(34) synthesis enzyme MnmG, partial [Hyphomicrobiaceae bacterium]